MRINFSSVVSFVALILVVVLAVGFVSVVLPDLRLGTPKIEIELVKRVEGTDVIVDTIVKIDPVLGAEKYEIYVDEEYVGYTLKESFSFKEIMKLDGGTHDVYVRAVRETSSGEKMQSDRSNVLECTCAAG